jgi:hypothetical protein
MLMFIVDICLAIARPNYAATFGMDLSDMISVFAELLPSLAGPDSKTIDWMASCFVATIDFVGCINHSDTP